MKPDKWLSPTEKTFAKPHSPAIQLSPGERHIFTASSDENWDIGAIMSVENRQSNLFVIGEIHYRDRYMTKRQTGYLPNMIPRA